MAEGRAIVVGRAGLGAHSRPLAATIGWQALEARDVLLAALGAGVGNGSSLTDGHAFFESRKAIGVAFATAIGLLPASAVDEREHAHCCVARPYFEWQRALVRWLPRQRQLALPELGVAHRARRALVVVATTAACDRNAGAQAAGDAFHDADA